MRLSTSDWIAITNSLATIVLSWFVFRATKKSADATVKTTNLTEQSMQLNRQISDRHEKEAGERREALRIQYTDTLWRKTREISRMLSKLDGLGIHQSLSNYDISHEISAENLAIAFDSKEVRVIHDAWFVLENYLDNYYKGTYIGDEIGILVTHADKPLEALKKAEQLLENIKWNRIKQDNIKERSQTL